MNGIWISSVTNIALASIIRPSIPKNDAMSAVPIFSLPTEAPNETDLLRLWLAARATAEMDVLRDGETYTHIWNTWCVYLAKGGHEKGPRPVQWMDVTPLDVVGFLNNGPTDRKKKGKPTASQITKSRYLRLIDRVYNFAKMNGWIDANPVESIAERDAPKAANQDGCVLDPVVWITACELLSSPGDFDTVSVRNRAILLVLFELGLSPHELRALKVSDLKTEPGAEEGASRITAIHVDGPGTLRPRQLPISATVAAALSSWIEIRSTLASAESGQLLFCTPRGPVSSVSLYLLVQKFLTKASNLACRDLPVRMGPQIIRNTLLVKILNEMVYTPAWVARFAGLKNVKGLLHLKHACREEVQKLIKNVRDDAPATMLAE